MAALTDPFDDFYGVVLPHQGGGPLLWSPAHRAWLRRRETLDWFEWADEPVDGDEPAEGETEAALAAAETFLASPVCRRCGSRPRAGTHFIALDVYGDPTVYCVQCPALEIVGSSGHTGRKKHLGSPLGCLNVKMQLVQTPLPHVSNYAVVGGLVYGAPLLADDVMLRGWCGMCVDAASQARDDAEDSQHKWHELQLDQMAELLRR